MKLVRKESDDIFDSETYIFEWEEDIDKNDYWEFAKQLVAFMAKATKLDSVSTTGEVELDFTGDGCHYFETAEEFAEKNEVAKDDAQTLAIEFGMGNALLSIHYSVTYAKDGVAAVWGVFDNEKQGDRFVKILDQFKFK